MTNPRHVRTHLLRFGIAVALSLLFGGALVVAVITAIMRSAA